MGCSLARRSSSILGLATGVRDGWHGYHKFKGGLLQSLLAHRSVMTRQKLGFHPSVVTGCSMDQQSGTEQVCSTSQRFHGVSGEAWFYFTTAHIA